ncbi:MAG TPA: TadE/TadG family type IV pilus assembly protein [Bryobacteraceae bacterium]
MISLANSPAAASDKPVRRRSKTQSGSAILEGALVILPLMAICFALMDFPLAIFIQNTLRNAVREGVRYAITQQTGAGGQDAAIKTVVENNSMGFFNEGDLTSTPPKSTFTITYYDKRTLADAGAGAGSNGEGNICVITATIQRGWMAPLWRDTGLLSFSASSSDVMEAPPGGILPSR